MENAFERLNKSGINLTSWSRKLQICKRVRGSKRRLLPDRVGKKHVILSNLSYEFLLVLREVAESNRAMTALKARNFSFGDIGVRVSVLLSSPKGKDNVISKFADGPSDWNDSKEAGR